MVRILVVYSSLFGANADLAGRIEGTLERHGARVRVRGVRQVVLADHEVTAAADHPEATADDLDWADGFVFTSPAHTGLLSAALKAFVDENHDAAVAGAYLNKTFTGMSTTAFAHAGQERVVDELNAIGSAWGCVVVAPSTANADLNTLDGNPWGLSFVLSHGKLGGASDIERLLDVHLSRFVAVTRCLLPLIGPAASPQTGDDPHPTSVGESNRRNTVGEARTTRYTIAEALGGGRP